MFQILARELSGSVKQTCDEARQNATSCLNRILYRSGKNPRLSSTVKGSRKMLAVTSEEGKLRRGRKI